MSRNARHVIPRGDGWAQVKPGFHRASALTDTQAAAIDRAREILGNDGGGELLSHRRDARIRDSDTVPPGNDHTRPLVEGQTTKQPPTTLSYSRWARH